MSPFPIGKAIQECIGSNYNAKKMNSGDLLIEVETKEQSNKIKQLEKIGQHQVSVTAHRSLNNTRGVISDRELLKCCDEEIEEALADQGVLAARTIIIRRDNKEIRTKNVVLTFASTTLPTAVKASYLYLRVRPYIPNPRRCFRCQRYGHGSQSCRGNPTCVKCGQNDHDDEQCTNPLQCINCKGPHAAYSRSCPEWKKEKEIITLKTKRNISYQEARKRMAFTQKGSYAQAVQRGQAPQMVSVGTQVQLQDMVAAVRPSNKPTKQAPSASSQGGPEASTSVGGSQHNIEVKQTSVTVPRSQPPLRRPAASQSTNSGEHPSGADSMEVCPLDTEGTGDPAPVSRPPRQPVVPPQGGKGGRNPVSAPKKST
ncbi:uncharacterized protein LOC119454478 [Dermacentor silvarum]|uniref:uncharacterized protein LOC119454478 n=1 Tax=Dermacentor silvarum TaxID=543639 RepID=UPI0018973E2E|nr:uncharacterized protein LOC119454478 [Dermacentor silvarum]